MRSWSSTEAGDALLRLRVRCFAAAVPVLVRLPLAALARVLEPARPRARADAERRRRTGAAVEAVLGVRSPLVGTTCLTRALTRYYFLRRAGAAVSLHFGVGVVGGAYAGHCWLTADGEPLRAARDPRPLFAETDRIAPRAGRG